MEGWANASALSSLNSYQTGQYVISLSLGKFLGQDGHFVENEFVRPLFTLEQRTSGDMTLSVISGGYQVTTAAGDKYIFDGTGKLGAFTSGNGQEISVTYDVNDRISRYEDTFGNFLEFIYDGSGKITSVEDADGHVSSYTYATDKLTLVEDDEGDTDFTYDTDSNLLTAQRVGGVEITFTYDAEARLSSQDIGGVSETYTYDNTGAITITNELSEEAVIQMGPGGYVAGIENNLSQSLAISIDPETRGQPPINESGSGVTLDKLWTTLKRFINGTEAIYGGADYRISASGGGYDWSRQEPDRRSARD